MHRFSAIKFEPVPPTQCKEKEQKVVSGIVIFSEKSVANGQSLRTCPIDSILLLQMVHTGDTTSGAQYFINRGIVTKSMAKRNT